MQTHRTCQNHIAKDYLWTEGLWSTPGSWFIMEWQEFMLVWAKCNAYIIWPEAKQPLNHSIWWSVQCSSHYPCPRNWAMDLRQLWIPEWISDNTSCPVPTWLLKNFCQTASASSKVLRPVWSQWSKTNGYCPVHGVGETKWPESLKVTWKPDM